MAMSMIRAQLNPLFTIQCPIIFQTNAAFPSCNCVSQIQTANPHGNMMHSIVLKEGFIFDENTHRIHKQQRRIKKQPSSTLNFVAPQRKKF